MASDEAAAAGVFHRFPVSRLPQVAATLRDAMEATHGIRVEDLQVRLDDEMIVLHVGDEQLVRFEPDDDVREAFAELDAIEDDPEAVASLPPDADLDAARASELEDLLLDAVDDLEDELVAWRLASLHRLVGHHWHDVRRAVAQRLYGSPLLSGPTVEALGYAVVELADPDADPDVLDEAAAPAGFGLQVLAPGLLAEGELLVVALLTESPLDDPVVREGIVDAIVTLAIVLLSDEARAVGHVQRRLGALGEAVVAGPAASEADWQQAVDRLVGRLDGRVNVAHLVHAGAGGSAVLRA